MLSSLSSDDGEDDGDDENEDDDSEYDVHDNFYVDCDHEEI